MKMDRAQLCALLIFFLVSHFCSQALYSQALYSQSWIPDPESPVYRELAIAADRELKLDKDNRVEGSVRSNRDISSKKETVITGDATASRRIKGDGIVQGQSTEWAPMLDLPALLGEAALREVADRIVEGDLTLRDERLDDILLVDGKVRIEGELSGRGTLIAIRDIDIKDASAASSIDEDSLLSLISLRKITIGKRRALRAIIVAGRDIKVGDDAVIEGVLVAHRKVQVKKGAQIRFVPRLDPESLPPVISQLTPIDRAFVAIPDVNLSAVFLDDGVGVNPASVVIRVDGIDRASESTISSDGFQWIPAEPLFDGVHQIEVTLSDFAGREVTESWSFTVDASAPSLGLDQASDNIFTLAWQDTVTGVDLSTLEVLFDGAARTRDCSLTVNGGICAFGNLPPGAHELIARLSDRAQNSAETSLQFTIAEDLSPPVIILDRPVAGETLGSTLVTLAGSVTDDVGVETVRIGGREVPVAEGRFIGRAQVREGAVTLVVEAEDAAGNLGHGQVQVYVDVTPPKLGIATPSLGAVVQGEGLTVQGAAVDESGISAIEINGQVVPNTGGEFSQRLSVPIGDSLIVVRATDSAGNRRTVNVPVQRDMLPLVQLTGPEDRLTTAAVNIDVTGEVAGGGGAGDDPSREVVAVTVNGTSATLNPEATAFTLTNLPLRQGANMITAVATAADGRQSTDSITIFRDGSPPRIAVSSPMQGTRVSTATIPVVGELIDVISGPGEAAPTVTVNGQPAEVAAGHFSASIQLSSGNNAIQVVATDNQGNRGETMVDVIYQPSTGSRLEQVSGGGQVGIVDSLLDQPIVVRALDAAGLPVTGTPVVFSVTGNNGSLTTVDDAPDTEGRRRLAITTDTDGLASARWMLGTLAGAGTQTVRATATGFSAPAPFMAGSLPGSPQPVLADSGTGQVGAAGGTLAEPIVAIIIDDFGNRLADVPVTFTVTSGGGRFAGGEATSTLLTDDKGRAVERWTLGPEEGIANNVVEARLAETPDGPFAGFVASGLIAGDPAATHLTGVVLDGSNQPLPGTTIRIMGTDLQAIAAENGTFRIDRVPVGSIHIEVDGSTVDRPGHWPHLSYPMVTVAGRENRIDRPVYLLPLDVDRGLFVDDTNGGILTLDEVPGFALEVAPGSVTFPDGTRSGIVSATMVNNDRVPMQPNFGQQPRIIFTVQPAGAIFDPPAKLTLPNVDSLEPGESAELYSFDHDLERFVAIGRATVSADATVMVANPGVGIVKAGWQCGGNPQQTTGAPHDCEDCKQCTGSDCGADSSQDGASCRLRKAFPFKAEDEDCIIKRECDSGNCMPEMVEIESIEGPCVAAIGESVTFTVNSNAPDKVKWRSEGDPGTGMGSSYDVTFAVDSFLETVEAFCGKNRKTKEITPKPSCDSLEATEPEVVEKRIPHDSSLRAGEVEAEYPRASYASCSQGGKSCFAVEKLTFELSISVQELDQTTDINITGAMDPAVTPRTCKQIIDDLTPPPPGTPEGPPRDDYWSQGITEIHEQFHVVDFTDRVINSAFRDFLQAVKSKCTDCPEALPAAELSRLLKSIVTQNLGPYNRDREMKAHDESNNEYRKLIEEIRQRAREPDPNDPFQRWPRACR